MQFFPDDPLDDSIPQSTVWEALKIAFSDDEGVAYYRYPVFDSKGLRHHEIDILLVLKNFGIFVIEVKGLQIRNIIGIQGHVWQTQSWYTPEEYPVAQAMNQSFALKNWFNKVLEVAESPYIHFAVALPFIQEIEWGDKGWKELPTTQCILTSAQLTSEYLKKWVIKLSKESPNLINNNNWLTVKNILGRTITPQEEIKKMYPRIIKYNGVPPTTQKIRDLINLELDSHKDIKPYLYIVATSFLEKMRSTSNALDGNAFNPALQIKKIKIPETKEIIHQPQLLFDNAIRHLMEPWLYTKGKKLAPYKSVERVYLSKAIDKIAIGEDSLRLQLQHDKFIWRDVLARLDAEGINLEEYDLDVFAKRLAQPDPKMVKLIADLQKAFHNEYPTNEISFEKAARWFIEEGLPAAPLIIMEGFSFFRPLQTFFIKRCQDLGAQLIFLHSYRQEQEFAFEALNYTYSSEKGSLFEEASHEILDTPIFDETDLDKVRNNLFSSKKSFWEAQNDRSIIVKVYPHRHAEVRECVLEIAELIKQRYEYKDIRIVSRDPDTYRSLLLEEVEMFRQEQASLGEEQIFKSDILKVPPRQLLLTPLGRFILTLYNVWDTNEGGRLWLLPEQFVTILSSGLLSKPESDMVSFQIQRSAKRFLSCRDQLFARCKTKEEWLYAFDKANELKTLPGIFNLPTSGLLRGDSTMWKNVLLVIETLCKGLFNTPDSSIPEHIKKLKDGLNTFDPFGMTDMERQLLENIITVLDELETKETTDISVEHFREVINGMVQERVEDEDGEGHIAVISPEGLDNSRQPIVFFLGADSNRLPRPFREPWPFYDLNLDPDLAQERYLFLAALRATLGKEDKSPRFYFSYAQTDNKQELQPSPYFQEVVRLLNIDNASVIPDDFSRFSKLNDEIFDEQPFSLRTYDRNYEEDPYSLSELFHYELCPYRYQLERLDAHGRYFTTTFQLRFLAQGIWLHLILDSWQGKVVKGPEEFKQYAFSLMNEKDMSMHNIFIGFTDQDWEEVSRNLKSTISLWSRAHLYNDKYSEGSTLTIDKLVSLSIPLPILGHQVNLDMKYYRIISTSDGRFYNKLLFTADTTILHWLTMGKKPDDINVKNQYTIVKDWIDSSKLAFKYIMYDNNKRRDLQPEMTLLRDKLSNLIKSIEKGEFPKKPGDNCQYCPNNNTCLGISVAK